MLGGYSRAQDQSQRGEPEDGGDPGEEVTQALRDALGRSIKNFRRASSGADGHEQGLHQEEDGELEEVLDGGLCPVLERVELGLEIEQLATVIDEGLETLADG